MNKAHELIKPISMDQFIAEHFLPLLKKVDDLTLSLKNEQEEKDCMLNKICDLEDQIESLTEKTKKMQQKITILENQRDIQIQKEMILSTKLKSPRNLKNNKNLEGDADSVEETWIFSCQLDSTIDQLKKSLSMETESIVELNCKEIKEEETMWIEILKKLETEHYDPKNKTLKELKQLGFSALSTALHSQTLILIRNFPYEGENKELQSKFIVSLCDNITKAWGGIEEMGIQELLGRIAVVIECEKTLEIIKIQKDNSEIVLIIEPMTNIKQLNN